MTRLVRMFFLTVAALTLTGCVVYEPVPVGVSTFDRSWASASGAARDQGVQVTTEDRSAGVIRGTRGPQNVSILVRRQADGTVRVEINATGPTGQDQTLAQRISDSYESRMGR